MVQEQGRRKLLGSPGYSWDWLCREPWKRETQAGCGHRDTGRRGGKNVKITIEGWSLEDQSEGSTKAEPLGRQHGSPRKRGSFWEGHGLVEWSPELDLRPDRNWRWTWEPNIAFYARRKMATSSPSTADKSPGCRAHDFHLHTKNVSNHILKSITFLNFKWGIQEQMAM